MATTVRGGDARATYCPSCGAPCPATSHFCHRCGAELIVAAAETEPAPAEQLRSGAPQMRNRSRSRARTKTGTVAIAALLAGGGLAAPGVVLLIGRGGETAVVDLAGALASSSAEAAPPPFFAGPDEGTSTALVPANDRATGGEEPAGAEEEPAADPLAGWQTCENAAYGFRLRYPAGWSTAAATPDQECTFFDPRPLEVDEDGPTSAPAVSVFVFPGQSFDAYASSESGDAAVQLERTELTVNGRRAQRVEGTVESENGSTRFYEYGLDFDGALVVVTTQERDAPDFGAAKAAVDGIVQSLEAL